MRTKTFRGSVTFKAGKPGSFRAVFSIFNVIDLDGDITLPGAFTSGQAVRIAAWGHKWHDLPVGRGVLGQDKTRAWVDGQFFMDTQGGLETYKTVKGLGELQEWSYGYDVIESKSGQFQGQSVRFLQKLTVNEVSPVMLGAGIGTHTESMKSAAAKMTPAAALFEIRWLSIEGPLTPARAKLELVLLSGLPPNTPKALPDPGGLRMAIDGQLRAGRRDALIARIRAGVEARYPGCSERWYQSMIGSHLQGLAQAHYRAQELGPAMPSWSRAWAALGF